MGFHYLAVTLVIISLKVRLCNGPQIHSGAQRHFIAVSEQLKLRYQEKYAIHVKILWTGWGKSVWSQI